MHITGLDHVQLAMPNGAEASARSFYGALLGLTEIEKPLELQARGGCWFNGPGMQIHLGVDTDFIPAQKAHPAFLVADLAAFQQMLETAGVPIIGDTTIAHIRRFYASDPFGNRLEFIQDGDGFRQ